MTLLSVHQGHLNWNHTVEFSSAEHHTNFETNQFTIVLKHDDVKGTFGATRGVMVSTSAFLACH